MNKRTLIAITLVLGLILGIGFGTSTVSADIDLNNLTWSVQSLVDESEQVFGQCQNVNPRSVRGLALSHDNNYLYLSYLQNPDYAGRVRKIDLSVADFEDQVVKELQLIDHRPGTPFTSAKALAVDDEGRVYMARGDGIQIWDADLGLGGSGVAGTEGTGSILPQFTLTGLNDSRGVALTREGGTLVMYVSDSGDDTLERYELTESAGSVTGATRVGFGANATDSVNGGELDLPAGASKPIGLEVAPDGTIWIADQSAGQVYRVNPDGTFPLPSSVSVTGAFDVAFDGNTALVSNGGGTVEAFNVADTSALTTVTPPFAALELRSLPGTNTALTGIDAIPDVAFYVAIEDGERPDQTIEGCADDADDNAPVLKAAGPDNDPPVADANGPYLVAVDQTITLDGSGSSDPDGDTLSCSWAVTGDPLGTTSGDTFEAGDQAGITEVTLTVDDGNGGTATDTAMVVVYDPTGGFVTGGGWIYSDPGAYAPDDTLEGKATFGFVSKYKKGASVPTGNTEFVFKAGGLNFHSSSYDWLVVTGSDYARFKGSGTINGEGDYKLMLWAGDDDPDTFRIKIWTELNDVETVVYDNGNQAIGGGSIVVHTSKK